MSDPLYLHLLTTETLMMREVCATIKMVAFHSWPGAPADVNYLSHRHRHLLTVRVWCQAAHSDRAVEYHQLQRDLRTLLVSMFPARQAGELELGNKSCEAVAEMLAQQGERLGGRITSVEVWEDDENGSRLTFGRAP